MDTFDKHQLRIARDTLRMNTAMLGVMGGPNRPEALAIIARLGNAAERVSADRELRSLDVRCPRCGAELAQNRGMGYETCSVHGPGHFSQPINES